MSLPNPLPKTVLALYENHPERWLQGTNARNKWFEKCRPNDPAACRWCLYGAILLIYRQNSVALHKVKMVLLDHGMSDNITGYNDSANFEEILNLVKEAGI